MSNNIRSTFIGFQIRICMIELHNCRTLFCRLSRSTFIGFIYKVTNMYSYKLYSYQTLKIQLYQIKLYNNCDYIRSTKTVKLYISDYIRWTFIGFLYCSGTAANHIYCLSLSPPQQSNRDNHLDF